MHPLTTSSSFIQPQLSIRVIGAYRNRPAVRMASSSRSSASTAAAAAAAAAAVTTTAATPQHTPASAASAQLHVLAVADVNNVLATSDRCREGARYTLDWSAIADAVRLVYPGAASVRLAAVLCAGERAAFTCSRDAAQWEVFEGYRNPVTKREQQVDETVSVLITEAAVRHRAAWEAGAVRAGLAIVLLSGDRDQYPAVSAALRHGCQVRVWSWQESLSTEFRGNDTDGRLQCGLLDPLRAMLQYRRPAHGCANTGAASGTRCMQLQETLGAHAAPPVLPPTSIAEDARRLCDIMPLVHETYVVDTLRLRAAAALGLKDARYDSRVRVAWSALCQHLRGATPAAAGREASWSGYLFSSHDSTDTRVPTSPFGLVRRQHARGVSGSEKGVYGDMTTTIVEAAAVAQAAGRRIGFQLLAQSTALVPAVAAALRMGMAVQTFGWTGTVAESLAAVVRTHVLDDSVPDSALINRCTQSRLAHPQTAVALVVRNLPGHLRYAESRRRAVERTLLAAHVPYTFFTSCADDTAPVVVEFPRVHTTLDGPLAATRAAMEPLGASVVPWLQRDRTNSGSSDEERRSAAGTGSSDADTDADTDKTLSPAMRRAMWLAEACAAPATQRESVPGVCTDGRAAPFSSSSSSDDDNGSDEEDFVLVLSAARGRGGARAVSRRPRLVLPRRVPQPAA